MPNFTQFKVEDRIFKPWSACFQKSVFLLQSNVRPQASVRPEVGVPKGERKRKRYLLEGMSKPRRK